MNKNRLYRLITRKVKHIGPGFVTGAADDDPSGIATYSIAGAQFGYRLNWLSLFLVPMMVSIQEMCGRIGMTSGMGLAGVIRKYHSKKLLWFTVTLLLIANVINIGADLGIMAASIEMAFGGGFFVWLAAVTCFSVFLAVVVPYKKYSIYLKVMGLSLLAYGITAFITRPDWLEVAKFTLIPHIDLSVVYFMTMVGFIGTTISPYLFFWQASEEVEEEIVEGEVADFEHKPHIGRIAIKHMQKDTLWGMIFSNVISSFIVITTATTLHLHGITDINSPAEAAMALKPLAGNLSYLLFMFGIVGIGMQSMPIFAGGIAYALSETLGFKEGLGKKFNEARKFYLVLGAVILIGGLINVVGINPIKALFYAAIVNGVVSVPLIFVIIKLADDDRIVGKFKTRKNYRVVGWITFLFILISTVAMIATFVFGIK